MGLLSAFEEFGASFVESGASTVERDTAEAAERAAAEKAERVAARNVGATEHIGSAAKKGGAWKWDAKKVAGAGMLGASVIAPDWTHDIVKSLAGEVKEVMGNVGGAACEGLGLPKTFCDHALMWTLGGAVVLMFGPKLL